MKHYRNAWTNEELDRLQEMWTKEGSTSTQIGKELGRTRGSVLGKIHRLNIANKSPNHKTRPISKVSKSDKIIFSSDFSDKDIKKPISMMELKESSCRWPVDVGSDVMYCGKTKERGGYCKSHGDMAYRGLVNVKD